MAKLQEYLPFFLAFLITFILGTGKVEAKYTESAHGAGSLTTGVSGRASGYAVGNCAHCHNVHSSRTGTAPTPYNYVTGGNGQDSNLCLDCHNNSVASVDDILATIVGDYKHNVVSYAGSDRHKLDESRADISAITNKHVYCVDCHNPHEAGTTKHTSKTPAGNEIMADSPLLMATGAVPTAWSGISFTAAASWDHRELVAGDKEYQICFKCHSSFNNLSNWGMIDPTSPDSWTEIDKEFTPDNNSYHPIVQALPILRQLDAKQLAGGWEPGDTMYCSDCHNTSSAAGAQGPHGSNVKWMLSGDNQAWPFDGSADNGKNEASAAGAFWSLNKGKGNFSGLFCMNCHPDPRDDDPADEIPAQQTTNAHTTAGHNSSAELGVCVYCHIRVPHGGKVSRLISTQGIPSRYYPNGDGSGANDIANFLKTNYLGYGGGNCKTTTAGCKGTGAADMHFNETGGETW